nr:MAG TPA: minor tail protein [Caudoviricetes sp.]
MLEGATQFRKNGFNDEDSAQLAQVAAMFSNVADEEVSAADSASFLISQLIAFNQTSGDVAANATHIVDSVNSVSNAFSVSSRDLSRALGVVASTSSAMGNSMESTLGMVTAITEQTRNAGKAANGLKTIMANLSAVLDSSSSDGEKITAIFKQIGVDMYDTNGQLKSGYELLKDLAGAWNNLDTNTQKYVAVTIANKTQLNNFLALMNNFDHAIDATNTALNSAGSAAKENEAYMAGLEAKVQALKQTFQELATNVINSDLVKTILDVVNALLKLDNATGNIVSKILLITGTAWGGASLLNVSKLIPVVSSQFNKFGQVMQLTENGAMNLKQALIQVSSVMGANGEVVKAGSVMTGMFSSMLPVILGVAAVFAIGGALYKATEDYRKTTEELNTAIEDDNEKLKTNKERLEEINSLSWKDKTPEILREKEAIVKENAELEKHIALLGDIKTIQAAQTLQQQGSYATGETQYQLRWTGANAVAFAAQTFGSKEELDKYLAEFKEKFGQTAEEAGAIIDEVSEKVSTAGQKLYQGLADEAERYTNELVRTGNINEAQYEDFLERASGYVEAAKQIASTNADEVTPEMWNLINAFDSLGIHVDKANGAMVNAASDGAIKFFESQKELYEGTERTERSILDSVAAVKIFNNTDLDVKQKLAALNRLATAAGYAAQSLNSVMLEAEINRLIEETDMKSMKEISETALNNLWGGIKKISNTNADDLGDDLKNKAKEVSEDIVEEAENTAEQVRAAWENYISQQKKQAEDAAKAQEELLKSLNDETNAYYDSEIEKLKTTNEELEKKIEYERLLEAMASARNKKQLVFKDGRFQYMSDMDAVATAQSNLDAYNREKKLEDDIAALEKERAESLERNRQMVYGTGEKQTFTITEIDENGNPHVYIITEDEAPEWMREGYGSAAEMQEAELRRSGLIIAGAQQFQYAAGKSYLNEKDWFQDLLNNVDNIANAPEGWRSVMEYAAAQRFLNTKDPNADISDILSVGASGWWKYYDGVDKLLPHVNSPSNKYSNISGYVSSGVPTPSGPLLPGGGAYGGINKTSNTNISVGNVDLPNVTNAQEFVAGLKNMALQKSYLRH